MMKMMMMMMMMMMRLSLSALPAGREETKRPPPNDARRERERERERERRREHKSFPKRTFYYSTTKGWSKNEPLFFMRRFEEEEKGLFSLSRVRLNNANKNTRKIDVPKRAASSRTTTPRDLRCAYILFLRGDSKKKKKVSSLSLACV